VQGFSLAPHEPEGSYYFRCYCEPSSLVIARVNQSPERSERGSDEAISMIGESLKADS